ncbi:MAG: hypothetical protein KAV87_48280 [Desulfobacteraceae bacterium]|nr:hypothetical protein [Desulfobacteraceae bacterium]
MATIQLLPSVKSDEARSSFVSKERLLNCFVEREDELATSRFPVYGNPGLSLFATIGTSAGRGVEVFQNTLYAVAGPTLYSVSSTGLVTEIGDVGGTSSPVSMTNDGFNLVIVSSGAGFVWDGTTFAEITDVDYETSSKTTFADNYTVFVAKGTNRYFWSKLLDPSNIASLDFASAEADPDFIVSCAWNHRQLVLFGEDTIQLLYNSGDPLLPFQPASSDLIERGLIGVDAHTADDNTVFWVGDDLIIYRLAGNAPQRVSTHAAEEALKRSTSVQDVIAYTHTEDGHKFICFDIPGQTTWVFDVATGFWSERNSFGLTGWMARHSVNAYNKNVFQDRRNGNIYYTDFDNYTENGSIIEHEIITPSTGAFPSHTTMGALFARFARGKGLTSGQGSDPQVMMRYSDDGGNTWSPERKKSMGKIGNYRQQIRWSRMGMFEERIFELRHTDPTEFALASLYADVEPGQT